MPDNPTPDMLKKMRMDISSTAVPVPGSEEPDSKKETRRATVEDVGDDDDPDNDFAPGGDADYFAEEDEEGRFFGGGLTDEQKQILSIFEGAEGGEDAAPEDMEELNITGVRKMLLKFDRAVKKNQDHRSKYPNDPTK